MNSTQTNEWRLNTLRIIKWFKERRIQKLERQLKWFESQISAVTKENENLVKIAEKCEAETDSQVDPLLAQRMAARRAEVSATSFLIEHYQHQRCVLRKKLGLS